MKLVPAFIILLVLAGLCLVSCSENGQPASFQALATNAPLPTTSVHTPGEAGGLPAPRWLTDAEKEYVLGVALAQEGVPDLVDSLGLSRTDIDWWSRKWVGDYADTGAFAYEYAENHTYHHEDTEYYPQVSLYFGTPEQALLRLAIDPGTGEVVNKEKFVLGPLPTSPESTPPPHDVLLRACPYSVVREDLGVTWDDPNRSTAHWYITSGEADCYEEFVGTVMQAAIDLYALHGKDHTSVLLLPGPGIQVFVAQAGFSADGRGAEGMCGSAPARPAWWVVQAADRPMTERELAIARLWFDHMVDFPPGETLSSSTYDVEALKQFIAGELDIPVEELDYPQLYFIEHQERYIVGREFIDWTLEQRKAE